MSRLPFLWGLSGVALGLGLGLGLHLGGGARPTRERDGATAAAELADLVQAHHDGLALLVQEQRRSSQAIELARQRTSAVPAANPAQPAPEAAPEPADPEAEARTAQRLREGRAILAAAIAAGLWTGETRRQFRAQLDNLSDARARDDLIGEAIVAFNTDKLRLAPSEHKPF